MVGRGLYTVKHFEVGVERAENCSTENPRASTRLPVSACVGVPAE
jgi:hypothetical protein